MALPLTGIRILSLAHQYPGPYATMLLSDLGADVVLVERPDGGDPARAFAGFHAALARGKRSIAVDLKHPDGLSAFRRLCEGSDVLLEGFRPGVMDRLGLGPAQLRSDLVYVSISGFGQTGPFRDRPGHDLTYQAEAGMLYEHLPPAPAPPPPSLALGDLVAALLATQSVLLGLFQRERKGGGSHLDVSMMDGLVSLLAAHIGPVVNGTGPAGFPYEPGYGVFATSDGQYVALGVAHEDHFWRSLCDVTDMAADRDLSSPQRFRDHRRLTDQLAAALKTRTRRDWVKILTAADVPFGEVRDLRDAAASPQVVARRMLTEDGHVRQPLTIDGTGPGPRAGVPRLGEHTAEVLAEAGFSPASIDAMIACGAVGT
jgi:crotonobetainyl-CoA:carnitine CoA-transferase CaiB-like acyl-CoA transferase